MEANEETQAAWREQKRGAAKERACIVAALLVFADDCDNSAHEDGAVALRYFAEALTGEALPSPGMRRALEGGE